jgi:hypothetical protein
MANIRVHSVFDWSVMKISQMKQKASALKKDLAMDLLDRAERMEYYELVRQIDELEKDLDDARVDYEMQKRKDGEL